MEKKNSSEREARMLLLFTGLLVFICCVLFIQNKKLEKLLVSNYGGTCGSCRSREIMNDAFNPYLMGHRLNGFEEEMNGLMRRMEKIQNTLISHHFYDDEQFQGDRETRADTKKAPARGGAKHEFNITTSYEGGSKEYRVDIGALPEGFNPDNMKVSLQNSILTLRTGKETRRKGKDGKFYSLSSFFQSFSIPETTATTKNVVKEMVDGGVLRLRIPITPSETEKK